MKEKKWVINLKLEFNTRPTKAEVENKLFDLIRDGFTLKTIEYSYTEFINAKSNLTVDKMLYDHRLNKTENINLAGFEEFSKIVSDLSSVLHSKFKENVYGK